MSKIELITQQLGKQIIQKIETSSTIYILTSFVMKSGVQYIKEALKQAIERNADIKICTGDYLYITQPEALEALLELGDKVDVRVWTSNGTSFHPKAYLFQNGTYETFYIGSSNLSKSALSNGVEWNVAVENDPEVFNKAVKEFQRLFFSKMSVPLNAETFKRYKELYDKYHQKHPNLAKSWSEQEEQDLMLPLDEEDKIPYKNEEIHENRDSYDVIAPRFAQIEALQELERAREEEYDKALVVMATGLGKTYLAAFFAKNFGRVLFIAHREEILHQAKTSFEKVMPDKSYGIYNGKQKEAENEVIFASIFTLSMKKHLEVFAPTDFDLIIVDEFHHAAAKSYQRVLDYFQPAFLLGITATPDRNDNKDVYAICGGNVAFRLDFLDAIKREWLAPFKYYGVYDETDYSQITWLGNHYDEEQLLQAQLRDDMAEKILKAWENHRQTRTIGFCSSIKQAYFLSNYFKSRGYKSVSLHSKQVEIGRYDAIAQLANGDLDIIFTVDLFNEGVDIPSVDTLLFVRPTESLTVFTQQVGRGLRLHERKQHCVIIDLIGNYRNADIKLSLFDTDPMDGKRRKIVPVVPELCEIDIDINVINLLEEMTRKRQPRRERLLEDYLQLKMELGRRPSYLELHLYGASEAAQYKQEFGTYYAFLLWAEELSDKESEVYVRYEKWFKDVEKTVMSKSYKMVVLLGMLERGANKWFEPITAIEVAPFFHKYLTETEYRKRKDFSDKSTQKLWNFDEKAVSKLIADMPMTKWSGSSGGLLRFEKNTLSVEFDVLDEDRILVYEITKEICEYRLQSYFARNMLI